MSPRRVIIVGGVAGGASCAARLRRLDEQAEIFVFERGPNISIATCGLPYYIGGVIKSRQQLLIASPERFRDWFNVEVRARHEVRAIDRQRRSVEVANVQTGAALSMSYDALVLALGATPVRPPMPGIDLPGVFSLRNLDDADTICGWIDQHQASRAVVIGAGYIGLEMVDNLARRGFDVTLVELLDQVMAPMDREMVAPLHAEIRAQGVDLRLSTGVTAIESIGGDVLAVLCAGNQRIETDMVIVCTGVRPDVGLARNAGLEIGPTGGIHVDDQMRTSDPAIFAVGDAVEVRAFVSRRPTLLPLAGPANRQGRIAADAICGRDSRFRGSQGTSAVELFGVTLAMTGESEKSLIGAGIPFGKVYTHSAHHAGYYPGAEMMAIKLLFAPEGGRVLGAQAVGRAGVDKRIDVIAMAIQMGATVRDLEEADLCYAPPFSTAKDPVNIAGAVAANVLRGDVDPAYWSQWSACREQHGQLPLILDVRSMIEAAREAVPGTVNIPLGEIRARLHELPRDREIWVHCGVGQRSYYATRILKQHGFQVRNLSGGLRSYKAQCGEP
jgi:NADPH-dependent 2,4-dienoyl-CoA reductase/sulfur reductase-like enzyme/rhodanese-related sulfurtransferase